MKWSGKRLPRVEDPSLLRGDGKYIADLCKDTKVVHFIRSPFPNGIIKNIDAPEDINIITAKDIKNIKPISPKLFRFDYKAVDQPILAEKNVKFIGQPIAAIFGDSRAKAEDDSEKVFIDIDPLDSVTNLMDAKEKNSPAVHKIAPDNVLVDGNLKHKKNNSFFQEPYKIIDFQIRSKRQNALPLETRGVSCLFDANSGRITLYASLQMPHMIRTGIADCLNIPESKIRVIVPDVGGGFGQKMSLFPEYVLICWLTLKFKKSFSWIEDRRENLIASSHSRDQFHKVKGAFSENGTIMALDVDIYSNVGAFSCYPVTCGVEPLMALAEYTGPYNITNYSARAKGIATNTCPMAPYRGVSRPVITFAMERLFEKAAKSLNIDPIEIRRKNLVNKFPYITPTGITLDEGSYVESLNRIEKIIDLPKFREKQKKLLKKGRYIGIGISVFNERTGYGTSAFAARGMGITPGFEQTNIEMSPSGEVIVRIGACPHGQGLRTTLTQIVSDIIGIDPSMIRIVYGDTDQTPYGWGTFASRSIVISGGATKKAADNLAEKIKTTASLLLQCNVEDIKLNQGKASKKNDSADISFKELARSVYHSSHNTKDLIGFSLDASGTYDPDGTYSNACHAAEVEVDIDIGKVSINKYIVVEDAGLLINPMIVDGQIHGGIAQGIANALFEEIIYDESGTILTTNLSDYLVPTMNEIPEIEIHHLETITENSITKAKGVGEGGLIGAPAASINAVADALSIFDFDPSEMPITPEYIRSLLRERKV